MMVQSEKGVKSPGNMDCLVEMNIPLHKFDKKFACVSGVLCS